MYEVDGTTLEDHLAKMRARELSQSTADKKDPATEPAGPVAMLTTAYGSKGLEFDRLLIVGLQTGALPLEKSSLEESGG
jgi:superfamily I DNA/RNA helicase